MPPQYTDHADQVIEKGTNLRLKILGVKPDVAAINAIGTIKEDYLGWVLLRAWCLKSLLTYATLFSQTAITTRIFRVYDDNDKLKQSHEIAPFSFLFYSQVPHLSGRKSCPSSCSTGSCETGFWPDRDRMEELQAILSSFAGPMTK